MIVDTSTFSSIVRVGGIRDSDIVVASGTELLYLSRAIRRRLRDLRLAVWVSAWFPGQEAFLRSHDLAQIGATRLQAHAVLDCEPSLLYSTFPEGTFDYYRNWIDEAGYLASLPLAFDRAHYEGTLGGSRDVDLGDKVVFVGGYWPYKGRSLRRYLLPFESRLAVYGYSEWPFGAYRGQLPVESEADVLRAAAVVPGINEPHAEILGGEVCERVYKVAGVGGLCVADLCFGYRELFTPDELLMPDTYEDYVQTVEAILAGELDTSSYRSAGKRAVYERHLYQHRAQSMAGALLPDRPAASPSAATVKP